MIRRRFLVYFLLLSTITVVATIAFETWSFRRAINHSLNQNLLFARSVSRVVGGLVADEQRNLTRLLEVSAHTELKSVALAHELTTVRAETLDADGVALFGPNRELIAAQTGAAGLPPAELLLGLLRHAQEDSKPVVTGFWRGLDHKPRVAIAQGRETGEGEDKKWRAAVIYLRLDGVNFQRVFSYFVVNAESRLQLLDSQGIALFSTQPSERYVSAVHGTYFTDKVRLGGEAQMQCHSCHKKGHDETVRETEVTTVSPVSGTDWSVTVREGTARLYAPMLETIYASTALVSLIFGCFVGFYLLLSRRVLRPMRQLAETANALALEHGAAVYGHDEFAQLAGSFAAMRARPASAAPPASSSEPDAKAERKKAESADLTPVDLRASLESLAQGVAASKAVASVLLHLRGSAVAGDFFVSHGIQVRGEGALGERLTQIAAGRAQVPLADVEAAGLVLGDAHGTKLFWVQHIAVADALEGELWIGVTDASETMSRYLGPTMAVIGAQVQSLVERGLLYEQLRQEQKHKDRMLRHLFEVESAERKHIAREIHDETAQELTALSLVLETIPTHPDHPEVQVQLEKAKDLIKRILDGINRLVRRLRPAVLDDMGLAEAVRATGQNVLGASGLQFSLEVVGGDAKVPKDVENTVYRVFQEAATNIVRHARAKRVTMRLHVEAGHSGQPGRLMGWIEDDGCGMDPAVLTTAAPNPRWGLLGMRERIVQVGGTVEFVTSPGGGLKIVFEVPFGATSSEAT